MSSSRTLSLVPPQSDRGVPDAEAWLAETLPVLRSIAHTLATTEGLYAEHAAPQLREETFQLRAALAERLGAPPLGGGPHNAPPRSAPVSKKPRSFEADLQDASLELLIEGIDLPELTRVVRTMPMSDSLRDAAESLVTIANLFDVAVGRIHGLEIAPERIVVAQLLEGVTQACWSALRARGITMMCASDTPAVLGDPDLLRRGLSALVERALVSMPRGSTLELAVSNGVFEVSFTGAFQTTASPMGGLELDLARLALDAHGTRVLTAEDRGRTTVGFELAQRERAKARLRRVA